MLRLRANRSILAPMLGVLVCSIIVITLEGDPS
jgi:hypothetical protein